MSMRAALTSLTGLAAAMTLLAGAPAGAMPVQEVTATPAPTVPSTDGRPREARLSVPALGVSGLRVVPYVGTPDDRPAP